MVYLIDHLRRNVTPQSEPMPGREKEMIKNRAGGYTFALDDWARLDRFLVLGTEEATYYASEREVTKENAEVVARCVEQDGLRAVARIAEISEAGRAPKNDPALLALAVAASLGDEAVRQAAFAALPRVARTGTHLLHFVAYVRLFRGWGRALRNGLGRWFLAKSAEDLAYQAIKYQARDGWSLRDLLRVAHPKAEAGVQPDILHWIVKGWDWVGDEPPASEALGIIWAFERLKTLTSPNQAAALIKRHRLPREAVPTELLKEQIVWEALLPSIGITALIRNLATMTRVGLIAPGSDATREVCARLDNADALRKGRVHPIQALSALVTYGRGKGARSDSAWTPVSTVVEALDAAFYKSFGSVESTGKRLMLALDVSGSMGFGQIAGVPGLTPRVGSAAMALVTLAVERDPIIVGFTGQYSLTHTALTPLNISARQRLDDVVPAISNLPMGATDCALPMLHALERKLSIDAFVVYTDNETWAGRIHPMEALRQYRTKTGIPAKLVVVGMTATQSTIGDPNDAGILDVVGFDTATPTVIGDFIRSA